MDTTKIKNTAKLLAIWFPIAIVVFLLAGFVFSHLPEAKSEKAQKIEALRQEMAADDVVLMNLTEEYKVQEVIVEGAQKSMVEIKGKADNVRESQNAKDQQIFNLTKGQPQDQFIDKELVKK